MSPFQSGRQPGDENLIVSFYQADPLNMKEEPTGKVEDFIRIQIPGDKHTVIDTMVTPEYAKRFAADYDRFKASIESGMSQGTPIESWGALNPGQVRHLKNENVHFVEQLASLSDSQCQRLGMGGYSLRDQARAKVGMAAPSTESMRAMQEQLAAQQAMIEQLMARLGGAEPSDVPEKRGPGRPRKVEA